MLICCKRKHCYFAKTVRLISSNEQGEAVNQRKRLPSQVVRCHMSMTQELKYLGRVTSEIKSGVRILIIKLITEAVTNSRDESIKSN
jgi:hypothetical protein